MSIPEEERKAFLHILYNRLPDFQNALLHSVYYDSEVAGFFQKSKTAFLNFFYEQAHRWEQAGYNPALERDMGVSYDLLCLVAEKSKRAVGDNLAFLINNAAQDAIFIIVAHNKSGAKSMPKILQEYGLHVINTVSKHHCKVFECRHSGKIKAEDFYRKYNHGLFSRAGVYGFDKIDRGSKLLSEQIPVLTGTVADLGCGYGFLSDRILAQNPDAKLMAFDNDIRAVEATTKNLQEKHEEKDWKVTWRDLRVVPETSKVNTVVMNPPFHEGKSQDIGLGQDFIKTAFAILATKGQLYMVANAHLPYEKILESCFGNYHCLHRDAGFKILKAVKE